MAEALLGGVAGSAIGRLALRGDSFNTGFGYGVYLTDSRIIGISYKEKFSRSYYPAYLVGLCFGISLTLVVVYAKLSGISGNQQIPYAIIWAPILWGLAASSMILLYLRPSKVAKKIMQRAPKSLLDLANESPDIVVERPNVSQVTVDAYRINVLAKSGQWYAFMIAPRLSSDPTKWTGQSGELFELFKRFCSLEPPITMWMKQHGHWKILAEPNGPSIEKPSPRL
ncbi:MAG TPA: hypothetical protein VNA15_01095 [Candidatus Angelobacter sp.]|nr:hypothetical protein [Candidatus Angelobacter sp.]